MADPFIGEIRIFAGKFAPEGWFFCYGQQLPIKGNEALYAVIGQTYGGDGRTYFNLPNLQGYAPVGQGNGTGLTPKTLGKPGGNHGITLTGTQIAPTHIRLMALTQQAPAVTPRIVSGQRRWRHQWYNRMARK